MVKVFKTVVTENDGEYWATNEVRMTVLMRLKYSTTSWMIETYHLDIKQFCGVERWQARYENAHRNYIEMTLRAFIRLKYHCFVKGTSWFKAKISITWETGRAYLAKPIYTLEPIFMQMHNSYFEFVNSCFLHHL